MTFAPSILFEEQARDWPARAALILGDQMLSYGETNARANQLARHLRKLGIGAERLVGVLLPRSPEVVIALLAILKAGGAFLLLDPESPRQRLQYVVGDARVAAVITTRQHASRLDGADLNLICVDTEHESLAREPQHDLPLCASATNLAYAVYTSGTTGKPKGTLVTHRSLVNHTVAARERYGFTAADRRMQFVPLSSDVFMTEVFTPLSSGAALVFGFESAAASIADFLQFVDRTGVTVTAMPSTYWHAWVASMADAEPVIPPSLRLVVSGMEQVHASAYEVWQRKVGGRLRWVNAYGPTETTCTASTFEPPAGELRRETMPIGRPIANTRIYLLDPDGNLVPVGIPGEINIGGDGVARGYLNQPELTAAKFVADPFSADAEAKLYRTGDLGAWLPDGNIVFLGRLDDQVKIRGYRVELGEIEGALRQHPDIYQGAVALKGDGDEQRLCAYVVLRPARSPSDEELRAFLAAHLPSHMMPGAIVRIDQLPLTPTGKVDRASLPVPAPDDLVSPAARVAPTNEIERRMAALWEEMLGLPPFGIHTDLFAVGGDSLLAIRAAARIQSVFGARVSVRDVFAHPTVAGLSLVVQNLNDTSSGRNPAALAKDDPDAHGARSAKAGPADDPAARRGVRRAAVAHAGARVVPAAARSREPRVPRDPLLAHRGQRRRRGAARGARGGRRAPADAAHPLREPAGRTGAGRRRRAGGRPRTRRPLPRHRGPGPAPRGRGARARGAPFDLAAAPPIRWTLFELGAGR